jgi:hypothetical protein
MSKQDSHGVAIIFTRFQNYEKVTATGGCNRRLT